MKTKLLINPKTDGQLDNFMGSDAHAVLLVGPKGSGKASLAKDLALNLLGSDSSSPYLRIVAPSESKAITIDDIREVINFFKLKVPGSNETKTNRVVVIEDAHSLGLEAQNALLKTLEEPPELGRLILTASHPKALAPTILSRVQTVSLLRPDTQELKDYFKNQSKSSQDIDQAYNISGGLVGLMHEALSDQNSYLNEALIIARQLLQQTTFERLTMVDRLASQKDLSQAVLTVLQRMAHLGLKSSKDERNSLKWQTILKASYSASENLTHNGQPKLVLTDLMLHF